MKKYYLSGVSLGRIMLRRALLVGTLGMSFAVQAQNTTFSFTQKEDKNPLESFDIGYGAHPTFVDLDGDGDFDMLTGEYLGKFVYYENTGTKESAILTHRFGAANPFNNFDAGNYSSPVFVDIDNDGDFDLISGDDKQSDPSGFDLKYYKNMGSKTNPSFMEVPSDESNPFYKLHSIPYARPVFVDLDKDGDFDLLCGSASGQIFYFQNTGTKEVAKFEPVTDVAKNPFAAINLKDAIRPQMVDLDKDGDFDLWVGTLKSSTKPYYFENTGTPENAKFVLATNNPFASLTFGKWLTGAFVDLDNDQDMDLMTGEYYGKFNYFENETIITSLQKNTNSAINVYPNPTNNILNIDISENAEIVLTDLLGKEWIKTQQTTIDVSNLPKGIYIVSIKTTGEVYQTRIQIGL